MNIVGRLANVLFGVCSDQDANFFYSNIESLSRSGDKIVHLAHEQVRIVSSVVNDVNSTMYDLINESQNIRGNIEELETHTRMALVTMNSLEIQNIFLTHTSILTILLNQFSWETQNLQAIVNSALNGLMHTSVFPPSEMIHELKQIQLTLPSALELPVTESHLEIPELFRISTLSVIYAKEILIFLTRIPLVSNLHFNLYHNIPLPMSINGSNFVLIEPQSQYLAISTNNEYHVSMTETQYDKCKILFSFKLCVDPVPINKHNDHNNCEVSLYNSPEYPIRNCNLKYLSVNTSIWHKLILRNSWLFYCSTQLVTITCHQESYKIQLTGVGKITIPDYCVIYTETQVLTPSRTFTSEIRKDFVPENPRLNTLKSWSEITENRVVQVISKNKNILSFNKLAQDARELDELEKLYKDTSSIKPEHHFMLVYIIIGTIVIISLYLLIKYKCQIPRLYLPEIAEPPIQKDLQTLQGTSELFKTNNC